MYAYNHMMYRVAKVESQKGIVYDIANICLYIDVNN